jgi:regulatory protein
LDDRAFADYWVNQRQTFHPRGVRALRAELHQKGVAEPCVSDALTALTSEEDAAYRAGLRLARRLYLVEKRSFTQAISAFLARRGFAWSAIRIALPRLWEARAGES